MEHNINALHSNCVSLELYQALQNEINAKLLAKDQQIQKLHEQLKLINHLKFGKQTEIGEKIIDVAANDYSADSDNSNSGELIDVTAYKRKKGNKTNGRLVDTSKLPRYKIIHELPLDSMCSCCGSALEYFSQESSEKLETIPKLVYCVEHIRYKYNCSNCEVVIMAPKEPAPIPKSLAGPSLLTDVIINKVSYHMPCYRQSKILANHGINIPDNTIGNWIMDSGKSLWSLSEALWQEIERSDYLQVDETPVKVLKPEKQGYIWTYYSPLLKFVVYDFALSRSGSNPELRLKNFKGKLQTDGYKGYNNLHDSSDVAFNCNTHARRKFTDVLKITKNKTSIAAEAVLQLQELYAIEDEAREKNLNFEDRKKLRQEKSKPIWDKYIEWLSEQIKLVPPKSRIGAAIQYTLNRVNKLIAYLDHGEIEIDTNGVENLIRPLALGRKNWLFIGHEESGKIYMLFYSLIQTCILQKINPNTYIHYILTKVHALRRGEISARELLPHCINKQLLEQFAMQQLELQTHVLNNLVFPS